MTTANHILAQEGILTTFLISKKVATKDIKKLREKFKNSKLDEKKFRELVKKSILEEVRQSSNLSKIPGLILPEAPVNDKEENKKIIELTYFSSLVAKKISEKKMGKYYACYIVNAIINMLELSQNDFQEFHKKFARYKTGANPEAGTTDE